MLVKAALVGPSGCGLAPRPIEATSESSDEFVDTGCRNAHVLH